MSNQFKIWFRVPDPNIPFDPKLITTYAFVNVESYENITAFVEQLRHEQGFYMDFWFVPWHQIILIEKWEEND